MSIYRTYITQLQWIKLSALEQHGSSIAPKEIQATIIHLQQEIQACIHKELKNAPFPQSTKEVLYTQSSPKRTKAILWKELLHTAVVLIEQAELLSVLTPQNINKTPLRVQQKNIQTEIKRKEEKDPKRTTPAPSKNKATSPFSFSKEDRKTPPITLTLPQHLQILASTLPPKLNIIQSNLAIEYGFVPPNINILFSTDSSYTLHFKNTLLGEGIIPKKYFFALAPQESNDDDLLKEPAYGKKGRWIATEEDSDGWRVITPLLILESHIHEIIMRNIQLVFDWGAFNIIIEQLEENHPALISKVLPNILSRKQLFDIYTSLLAEDIPINNHEPLLKTIYAFRSKNKGIQFLIEQIRRHLFDPMRLDSQYLYATLSKPLEKILRQGLVRTSTKESFKIDKPILERLLQTITELEAQCSEMLVLIVPSPLRAPMQALITPHRFSSMRLLSNDDIEPPPERHYADISLNEVLYR